MTVLEVVDVELVHREYWWAPSGGVRGVAGLEATRRGDPGDVEHLGEVGVGVPVVVLVVAVGASTAGTART